jgi:lysophospholipase L1-like esterase
MVAGSAWRTVWAGKITGTTAKFRMNQGGSPAGTMRVVVNGGAEVVCPNISDLFTLFEGLPQAEHDVIVRISDAAGIFGYWVQNWTDALQVTGSPPSFYTYPVAVDSIAGNPLAAVATVGSTSTTGQATYLGANWSPNTVSRAVGNSSNSWRVRTAATEMCVYTRSQYVYYTVDGGAPIRVDSGSVAGNTRSVRIALTGTRTYNVWTDRFSNSFGQPATLCLNAPLIDVGATKGRLFQWGTSLTAADDASTAGHPLTSTGECDVYGVAAAINKTGQQLGRSGSTLTVTRANIDTDLIGITNVTSDDWAIVEMGRNDATPPLGGTLTTQRQEDYNYIVTALLNKGFGRVYLRAMIPEGSNSWADYNTSLSALVVTRADARVRYLDASNWVVTSFTDGVHYDDVGYSQIRTQEISWFQGNP